VGFPTPPNNVSLPLARRFQRFSIVTGSTGSAR
jgi:hypothetical protein